MKTKKYNERFTDTRLRELVPNNEVLYQQLRNLIERVREYEQSKTQTENGNG